MDFIEYFAVDSEAPAMLLLFTNKRSVDSKYSYILKNVGMFGLLILRVKD